MQQKIRSEEEVKETDTLRVGQVGGAKRGVWMWMSLLLNLWSVVSLNPAWLLVVVVLWSKVSTCYAKAKAKAEWKKLTQ